MSRIIERRFFLKNKEKRIFRSMMRRVADFSDVDILSYCIMDNHFHILIRVRKQKDISDELLLSRIKCLYSGEELKKILKEYEGYEHNRCARIAFRKRYMRRMNDLSEFMKTLKQRFAIYYNRNNGRLGTLWEDRFKSVLIESPVSETGKHALLTVGAYIDLNALRAGIVDIPMYYRWCSVGEAYENMQNGSRNRMAVDEQMLFFQCALPHVPEDSEGCCAWYYDYICERGDVRSHDQLKKAKNNKNTCIWVEMCNKRNRYLSDGLILGGKSFVTASLSVYRRCFISERVRRPVGLKDEALAAAKSFRRERNLLCRV